VVQGFGNVGYHASRILQYEGGAKIVAISEYEGAIYNPDGLDMDKLYKHRKKTGSILKFPGSKKLKTREAALELKCDILIPAALENQITKANASRIKARIIAEAANGPVTAEADKILLKKKIMVVPDMYINAGGVTVSYFEWLKNLTHMRFGRMEKRFDQNANENLVSLIERSTGKKVGSKERSYLTRGADEIDLVNSGLEETMITAYSQFHHIWKRNKDVKDLRTAAFVSSISKIAQDYISLGIFP